MPGRLTAVPNEPCDPRAHARPGTTPQRGQECLTTLPWDAEALNRPRGQQVRAAAPRGDGVLVGEDTGVPPPGQGAVGGARPSWGALGQGGHGQVAVPCGAPAPPAPWPLAGRWPLPAAWAADRERRQQARGPSAVPCPTTPERALALREQARGWGVPARGVGAEAAAGDHPPCWARWAGRPAPSGVGGRRAARGRRGRAARRPGRRGAAWLQPVPRWPWRPRRWRQGATGGRRKTGVAVRWWRVTAAGQRQVGGLGGERARRGQPEARQAPGRHLPATAPREAVEPGQAEAKGELGWDHDRGRLWPGGHRPAGTVRRADRVLVWLARRHRRRPPRRGRPRAPCPPSAGAAEALAASEPSRGRPVAAPPSRPMGGDNGSVHATLLTKDLTE